MDAYLPFDRVYPLISQVCVVCLEREREEIKKE